ncbi:hypothetical protein HZA33_02095 [Candidatus Pacearchaeota archaeon]|nr:hypothetical protein [Candidatus Pacearchaeota archaeon]
MEKRERQRLENFLDNIKRVPEHHLRGIKGFYVEDLNKSKKINENLLIIDAHYRDSCYNIIECEISIDERIVGEFSNGNNKDKREELEMLEINGINHCSVHEVGHHVWYALVPLWLKVQWKLKCLDLKLYNAAEEFADQYESRFSSDRWKSQSNEYLEGLMDKVISHLEKNKSKPMNSEFHRIACYFFF